ncbi:MAG: hypothetical protein ACLUN0_13040 [Roseburia sp.]
MQEIPVYLFTGFMDSGKTTLIKETLFENDFGGDKPYGNYCLCARQRAGCTVGGKEMLWQELPH